MELNSTVHSYSAKANLFFERFLRHGQRWKAREVARDTGEGVSGSYISALLKGKIGTPGEDIKIKMADAMGFPPTLWEMESTEWEAELDRVREEAARSREHPAFSVHHSGGVSQDASEDVMPEELGDRELADLLNFLFDTVLNRRTGQRYTEQQIAIYSNGTFSVRDIRQMRDGESPPVRKGRLISLSDAFEVPCTFWARMSRHEARATGLDQIQSFLEQGYPLTQGDHSAMLHLLSDMSTEKRARSNSGAG